MSKIILTKTQTIPKEEVIPLPLLFSAYVENGYVIMNFNKRIILNDGNKEQYVDFLNAIANGEPVKITCSVSCRETIIAKNFLKKLGLLKPIIEHM